MRRPTQKELELSRPGVCVKCGADSPDGRDTGGNCTGCHNQNWHNYQAERAAWREKNKQQGREYWRKRGIRVGSPMRATVFSIFGFIAMPIDGVAAVSGRVGAYVHSKSQPGYLSPDAFSLGSGGGMN